MQFLVVNRSSVIVVVEVLSLLIVKSSVSEIVLSNRCKREYSKNSGFYTKPVLVRM